jgi:hypothetical protein
MINLSRSDCFKYLYWELFYPQNCNCNTWFSTKWVRSIFAIVSFIRAIICNIFLLDMTEGTLCQQLEA